MVQLATFPHEELLAMFWYAPPTQCIFALDAPISNVLQTSLLTTPWKVSTTKISTEVNQSEHAKGPSMVIEPGKYVGDILKISTEVHWSSCAPKGAPHSLLNPTYSERNP